MIVEFYTNPNKPAPFYAVYTPVVPLTTKETALMEFYANKKKLTLKEYLRRNAIVEAEFAKCTFKKGDIVYPYSKALYANKGTACIQGVYSNYSQFETSDWNKEDRAFIVTAYWVDTPNETLFCTATYLQVDEPTK